MSLAQEGQDSIVYIDEPPVVIHQKVEIFKEKVILPHFILSEFSLAPSFFNYTYSPSNTNIDKYLDVNNYKNLTLQFALKTYLVYKKWHFGLEFNYASLSQSRESTDYIIPYTKKGTYLEHINFLSLLGRQVYSSNKVSIAPKLGLGIAYFFSQGGLIPVEDDIYNEVLYSNEVPPKLITPIFQIELPIQVRLSNKWGFFSSYYYQRNILSFSMGYSKIDVSRRLHGIRLGFNYKFSLRKYLLDTKK